ncbi:ABC transporter substrate-binding protein [Robbsia andropogonis]|uniref:ABC transporter substrate-binding protein n=1 Tax=Robbsia andropogonis TaxID=28092 RepID=UPI003D1AE73A
MAILKNIRLASRTGAESRGHSHGTQRRLVRTLLAAVVGASVLVAVPAAFAQTPAKVSGTPYLLGVSGPLTGQDAQYGEQWKRGFDLALEDVNSNGGIKGRPLAYDFEDSRSDPRQSIAIAQKFVGNRDILMELGDFSSAASMAASPVYQRGKLVQFGFTNSHPDFTKGGDYMWSTAVTQAEEQPLLAHYAVKDLGFNRIAVLYLNTDWGQTSKAILTKTIEADGAKVVAAEGYQPTDKDFRATLVRINAANPDAVVLISYYADGAQIVRQARGAGLKQPIAAVGSIYSPKFLELAGEAANGVYTQSNFFPQDPRPNVQEFVKRYKAKYNTEPGFFAARAYDAVMVAAYTLREAKAPTRQGVHDELAVIRNVPSVIYNQITFDPATRRVAGANTISLQVKDGKFALWDKQPAHPQP